MHIVIIGLPGSGKSTLLKQYAKNYIIYDDFISSFFTGDLENDLLTTNKSVCVADPRLCDPKYFRDYIVKYFPKNNTKLLLFENDPNQCLQNIILREKPENLLRWQNTINRFTNIYSYDNYENWDFEIIKVFKLLY